MLGLHMPSSYKDTAGDVQGSYTTTFRSGKFCRTADELVDFIKVCLFPILDYGCFNCFASSIYYLECQGCPGNQL